MQRRLAHDILDAQLVDRRQVPFGKVDGIVLEQDAGGRLRVVALEVGALTLARRLHPRFGAWLARHRRRLGVAAPEAVRIPWEKIRHIGRQQIRVDIDATATPLWSLERWLAERIVARLPGGG
jgi:hypothetical protein